MKQMGTVFGIVGVPQRVAAGIQWLDKNVPDWRDRVNPTTLVMSMPCRCVLGQLYGSCWLSPLGYRSITMASLGFDVYDDSYYSEYAELEAEWLKVLS